MRSIDLAGAALRNLARQRLRSALTIFAIVIGSTSVTIMLALVTGAQSFFISQFESTGQLQQVIVSQATDLDYEHARFANSPDGGDASGVRLTDALAAKIAAIPHVAAVARNASPSVFDALVYEGQKLAVENVQASDANGVITHPLLAGRDLTAQDGVGLLLISQPHADKLGFAKRYDQLVGKSVTLVTRGHFTGEGATITPPQMGQPNGPSGGKPAEPPPTQLTATIVGVVAGDDRTMYLPLGWARGLLTNRRYEMTDADRRAAEAEQRAAQTAGGGPAGNRPPTPRMTLVTENELDRRGYNSFTVKADRSSNVESVAKDIRALGLGAATARSFVDAQLKIFQILGYVLGGIGGIALIVAAIGVINTMVMAIFERTREIGVMRACGATRATIRKLFTVEAGLLGFLGGVVGVAVGYGLSLVANVFINKQLVAQSVAATDIIGLSAWLILAVIGATTVIGMVAGLYPAVRASRLNPVQALHYE